jgi:hypothetical protein
MIQCPKKILIALQKNYLQGINPLIISYRKKAIDTVLLTIDNKKDLYTTIVSSQEISKVDSVLCIDSADRIPHTLFNGPLLNVENGKKIPIGLVPLFDENDLQKFVKTAVAVHERESGPLRIAILAQRLRRYIDLATRIESLVKQKRKKAAFRWTGDLVFQEDMILGLKSGIGVAIYVGHGRSVGWAGYYGTRIHHFTQQKGLQLGALLSVCCLTAKRKNDEQSFAEAVIFNDIASSSLGAIKETLFTDNTRWVIRICESLNQGARTIGELLVESCPPNPANENHYRLFGDPMAPLQSWVHSLRNINKVKVYT